MFQPLAGSSRYELADAYRHQAILRKGLVIPGRNHIPLGPAASSCSFCELSLHLQRKEQRKQTGLCCQQQKAGLPQGASSQLSQHPWSLQTSWSPSTFHAGLVQAEEGFVSKVQVAAVLTPAFWSSCRRWGCQFPSYRCKLTLGTGVSHPSFSFAPPFMWLLIQPRFVLIH